MIAISNGLANVCQSNYWPFRLDGDVGVVVVEDGAGSGDDFLVALNLRHNLLLHIQRRQGNVDLANNFTIEIIDHSARSSLFKLGVNEPGTEYAVKKVLVQLF